MKKIIFILDLGLMCDVIVKAELKRPKYLTNKIHDFRNIN